MSAMQIDSVPLDQIRRALIIKLRHHGDVLLTSPVFSVLKRYAPQIEIDALVYSETAEMLTEHPAISSVHIIDRSWRKRGIWHYLKEEFRLIQSLRNRNYDLLIHLTEHPRGAWLSRLLAARWAVAPATGRTTQRGRWWRDAFTHIYTTPRSGRRHTVEIQLDALRRIGIFPQPEERQLALTPGGDAKNRIDGILRDNGLKRKQFIHIHPASRWNFKCWPAFKMANLIDALSDEGHTIVLTGAPTGAEKSLIQDIIRHAKASPVDLSGILSLKELAALSENASLFIGVDSAPMHIAAAMQTPTVAIFGPSGEIDWGPWHVAHRIVASQSHLCRPCGQDGCGGSKISDCLVQLEPESVLAAVRDLLQ